MSAHRQPLLLPLIPVTRAAAAGLAACLAEIGAVVTAEMEVGVAGAVGADVAFGYVVLVVPMIYLLEALPISINGLGVREGAFIFFFTKAGLGFERALAISLMVLFFLLVKVLVGGGFFLLRYLLVRKLRGVERQAMTVPGHTASR